MCTSLLKELKEGMGSSDFYLISNLGVVRTISKGWRHLLHYLCGMELFNLLVKTAIAQINCLLQHCGTGTFLKITLMTVIKHLQVEIGVTGCPFLYDFNIYMSSAIDTWAKLLWGEISKLGMEVTLEHRTMKPP